jgi:hypothetical protein
MCFFWNLFHELGLSRRVTLASFGSPKSKRNFGHSDDAGFDPLVKDALRLLR